MYQQLKYQLHTHNKIFISDSTAGKKRPGSQTLSHELCIKITLKKSTLHLQMEPIQYNHCEQIKEIKEQNHTILEFILPISLI